MTLSIIVPYRDREEHKNKFIPYMRNYLSERGLKTNIYIIEQNDKKPFNRGKLLNIGFEISQNNNEYFCFHDVDMLPEEADYGECEHPTHLATNVQQFNYSLPYYEYFGGVLLFDKNGFKKVNGFSNEFWGWGVEDDDLLERCKKEKLLISRRQSRFYSLNHKPNGDTYGDEPSPETISNRKRFYELKNDPLYYKKEGLNTLRYDVFSVEKRENFTLVKVNL